MFLFLVPLFPIVQDQWLNIFLLNKFEFSYYPIIYFLSGFLFPILVINNSLSNFYKYKFNPNKFKSKKLNFISYLITFTVLILSILTIKYFIFSIRYIVPQVDLNIYFDIKLEILSLLIVIILLSINKTKMIIKKLVLLNFFIICFVSWTIYALDLLGFEIFINKYISNTGLYDYKNLNILNIFYLLIFEIFYYIWSFLSHKDNLSDWSIPYPKEADLIPLTKITIFYIGVLSYYLIFNRIN